jgi:hypothetical protein
MLGQKVEFEVPERKTVALQDDADLTLFLYQAPGSSVTPSCALWDEKSMQEKGGR